MYRWRTGVYWIDGKALGVVWDYFGLGYLGDAGEEVFEVKCGHQKL